MDELSNRERQLIEKIRATKNPDEETTYLTSYRDSLLRHGKQQPSHLPAPRAAS